MTTLAVIIARSGSKGLTNKSMQMLAGKPLVAWTIEHALGCHSIDHLVLTTDGPDISQVGLSYDIRVYMRPPELATDQVTVDAVARHGVACWEREYERQADHVAIMYGNVPLRPPDLTDRALAKLMETGAHSVQSVYPVGKMHPLWMRTLGRSEEGLNDVLGMYQPNQVYRRQDLPPVYMIDAGALVMTREVLFQVDPNEPHAFLGSDRRAIETEFGDVVDVDCAQDLRIAEVMLAMSYACT